jgi:hypothetical protein
VNGRTLQRLFVIWLGWAVLLLGFQVWAPSRIQPARPDRALAWTAAETATADKPGQPYLKRQPLKAQAAWDSEYYLSIALGGYDDPAMRALGPNSELGAPQLGLLRDHTGWTSVNYAFFPAYPFAMRLLSWPLRLAGAEPVFAASLAGVAISLAGTLAAILALHDLAGGREHGDRAAVYLLLWPAAAFLAQVYTEGLFLGLSFWSLALARRGRWAWASALAVVATLTRATGALLVLPLAWSWIAAGGFDRLRRRQARAVADAALIAAPAIAYLGWRLLFGARFNFVEEHFFGRGLLWLGPSVEDWKGALTAFAAGPAIGRAYYLIEFLGLGAGILTAVLLLEDAPALALYGLAIIALAMTSGAAQGMHRYVLSSPALFLVPARWGANPAFDRLWSLAGALGLAVLAIAFSVGFWAG